MEQTKKDINMPDPIGKAVMEYYETGENTEIIVSSEDFDDDVIPTKYLFRQYDQMPKIERIAIEKCQGNVLDVGAAAGCHSLILQKESVNVTAIDISEGCCTAMAKRGVKKVSNVDFFQMPDKKYDTLLFLMNGIGIAGKVEGIKSLLVKSSELLRPDGQILFDSSDIRYLFEDQDDKSFVIDLLADRYYGELVYTMRYKDVVGKPFDWIFADYNLVESLANTHGFDSELLFETDHYQYLARLTKKF